MTIRTIRFDTADGIRLEGRLAVPEDPRGGAVLCHPHPQYDGSMSSVLMPPMQRALASAGWCALRFNFRGVGRSEGTYGGGIAELRDVAAALDRVAGAVPGRPLAVAGWSFGALVGLAGAVADERVRTYVAVAPPVSIQPHLDLPVHPPPERLAAWRGRALAICGTADGFVTPAGIRTWAAQIPGAEVRIFDGEDHFFSTAPEELANVVAEFIAKE